jgi:hypothetical protein
MLQLHRTLLRAALGLAGAFFWIGVYRYFYQLSTDTAEAFARTAFLYALSQVVTILAVPWAAQHLSSGLRRIMARAVFAVSLGLLSLGVLGQFDNGILLPLVFIAYTLLFGLYAAMYRTPHTGGLLTKAGRVWRGLRELCVIAAPALGGYLMSRGLTLPEVLGIGGAIAALSLAPLSRVAESYERYAHGYRETFGRLLDREHRALLLHGVCAGIEGTALLLAWPIVIFLITDRSFSLTGALLSVSLVTAAIVRVLWRRLVSWRAPSPPVSMALAGSPWILRLVAAAPIDIVVVDAYAHGGASPSEGIDRAAFEQHADGAAYFDEYTVLKEEALALGRLLAALGVAAFALDASLSFALVALFVAAGLASMFAVSVSLRVGRAMF